jgi:hypothetical protein
MGQDLYSMTLRQAAAAVSIPVLFFSVASGRDGEARLLYVSPLPDSRFVPLNSSIAFRTGATFDGPRVPEGVSILVQGLKSGIHPGRLALGDDRRTLIFNPGSPFASNESVSVAVVVPRGDGLPGRVDTVRYTFRTVQEGFPDLRQGPPREEPGSLAPNLHRGKSTSRGRSVPDTLPQGFPNISVNGGGTSLPLTLFMSNFPFDPLIHSTPFLMTLGRDGTPAFVRRMKFGCFDFKKQPGGLLTYHDQEYGYFMAMDSTFAVVDSFKCGNGYPTDVHELRLLPNGHALILGYDPERIRMDSLVEGGDSAAIVYGLILQELDQSRNVVFQWRSWDHFSITDAIGVDLTSHVVDYAHGNAVELAADSNYVISSRHLSEITKINRHTGEIMWRWGGKNNQFTFVGDSIGFSYQHMIRRLPNGHWTLFDNGNFHAPQFSRAVEYVLDEERMTATLVWQYRHTPDLFGSAMGSVERMEDGSTLIGWGATNPSASLVDPVGRMLFEISLPEGVFSYRAFAVPGSPLASVGPVAAVLPQSLSLAQNYPNPFNPATTILYVIPRAGRVRLAIYDLLGREVAVLVDAPQASGRHLARWEAYGAASGTYFYRLQTGESVRTMRMTLLR